jgi:hypothetical protein
MPYCYDFVVLTVKSDNIREKGDEGLVQRRRTEDNETLVMEIKECGSEDEAEDVREMDRRIMANASTESRNVALHTNCIIKHGGGGPAIAGDKATTERARVLLVMEQEVHIKSRSGFEVELMNRLVKERVVARRRRRGGERKKDPWKREVFPVPPPPFPPFTLSPLTWTSWRDVSNLLTKPAMNEQASSRAEPSICLGDFFDADLNEPNPPAGWPRVYVVIPANFVSQDCHASS